MARRKQFGPALPPAMKKARAAAKKASKTGTLTLMKSVAERVVNRELETKFVTVSQNGENFNSRIFLSSEFRTLIPALEQAPAGTVPGDWQRVGNNISPISCKTHFTVSLYPRLQSVDIIVVLYCLKRKQNKNFIDLLNAVTGQPQLLKTGTSTETTYFSGLVNEIALPINNDEYTLLNKKVFRLSKNVGVPNGESATGMSPNIPGHSSKSFTIVTKLPQKLCYKPGVLTASYPENDAPFWVLGYAHADGTTNPDTAYTDVNVSYSTQMFYKDA